MVLVDLHCHLLPGIDDGSKDWNTSLDLARQAVENGVTHALLTPHHLNGRYVNHKADVIALTAEFQQRLAQEQIPLTVFAGQEVRMSGGLLPALDQGDLLFADEGNRYLMLEFPSEDVPSYAANVVFQLRQNGVIPVIVHPERNARILARPKTLQEFLEQGCLTLQTASSYMGTFGSKVERLTKRLIEAGQGCVFASDAHDLPQRQYELRQALDKLETKEGEAVAQTYRNNARAILNGETPIFDWQPLKANRFWHLP